MTRKAIILLFLFLTTTMSAQFSLQLEQGITISDDVNYKPIGIGLDYQAVSWKGFELSVGLAFDQIFLVTKLPLESEFRVCYETQYFCNFDDATVKSHESRLFIPLRLRHRKGRFAYGLELRPGFRIYNTLDFTYPVLAGSYYRSTTTLSGRYGVSMPTSENVRTTDEYTVSTSKFQVQLGANLAYDLSERFNLGLSYRYEGFTNDNVEVSKPGLYRNSIAQPDRLYFKGRSQVHYLVAILSISL